MRRRLDSLTGLRFFAAAAVVVYHLAAIFHPSGALVTVTGPGFIGVTFFFVLSGLVLTWSRQDGESAERFYWHRFARIWPLHALTWAVVGIVLTFGSAKVAGANIVLLQAWVPKSQAYFGVNSVAWTLSCEAFFYALFPLLLPAVRRTRSLRLVAAGIGGMALIAGVVVYATASARFALWFLYVFPVYRLGEFALGVVLGTALQRGHRLNLSVIVPVALIVAGVVIVATVRPMSAMTYNTPRVWLYDMCVLPGVVLLLWSAASSDLQRPSWLGSRPLRVLGEWSFALYMTHQVVMRIIAAHKISSHSGWVNALVAAILVVPVAAVAHLGWEKPIERRLRLKPRATSLAEDEAFGATPR